MSNHNNDNGGASVMLAFLVGAIAGAACALLYAPASGEETREYLGQKARESKARAREAVDQGKEVYQRQRETITTAVDRGREAFQQARTPEEQGA